MINSILNLFKKPITTTNEEANSADLKKSFIKAGIISAIFFVCNFITSFISEVWVEKYDYDKHEYVNKLTFENFEFEDVISPAITNLIAVFIVILVITTIMYVISRILQNENSFSKLLTITSNAFIPMAAASVISLITSWYAPIGLFATLIAGLYAMFILVYSFRNTLTIENEDKLTLLHILIITAIAIVLYFLAGSVLEDMFSLGSLLGL